MSNSNFYNGRYIQITEMPFVEDLVTDNSRVRFSFYRSGFFYYIISMPRHLYEFQIPLEDVGNDTLHDFDRATTYIRWIRKAIEDKTLQELRQLMAQ